jgi:hypothetical protein
LSVHLMHQTCLPCLLVCSFDVSNMLTMSAWLFIWCIKHAYHVRLSVHLMLPTCLSFDKLRHAYHVCLSVHLMLPTCLSFDELRHAYHVCLSAHLISFKHAYHLMNFDMLTMSACLFIW